MSVPDGGGGDAHQTGAGEGGAGEISAVQRRLQRYEEGKGSFMARGFAAAAFTLFNVKYMLFYFSFFTAALLLLPNQKVLPVHLVLHLPVLQKVKHLIVNL